MAKPFPMQYDPSSDCFYPLGVCDTCDWSITIVQELSDDVHYLVHEYPMYGGPALSEDRYECFNDAVKHVRSII